MECMVYNLYFNKTINMLKKKKHFPIKTDNLKKNTLACTSANKLPHSFIFFYNYNNHSDNVENTLLILHPFDKDCNTIWKTFVSMSPPSHPD